MPVPSLLWDFVGVPHVHPSEDGSGRGLQNFGSVSLVPEVVSRFLDEASDLYF